MISNQNPPESTSARDTSMVEDHTTNASSVVRNDVASSVINAGTKPSMLAMIGKERCPSADTITVTVEEKTESSPQPVLSTEKRKLKCKSQKEKNKIF